ncbi:Os02g0101750, partial [Oryza sativa Japonica Group]
MGNKSIPNCFRSSGCSRNSLSCPDLSFSVELVPSCLVEADFFEEEPLTSTWKYAGKEMIPEGKCGSKSSARLTIS